jgi:hypothetical protein
MYTKYLNVKTKLHKTIANIYFTQAGTTVENKGKLILSKEEVEEEKASQEERFLQGHTQAGTRKKPPFFAHCYDDNSSQ